MLKLPLLKTIHIEYTLVPDIATSFKVEFTFPRLLLILIGSLKILPASILPTKNISKWEFAAEVILSSQVIATLLLDTSMFGF
jgi:hypothetical protein